MSDDHTPENVIDYQERGQVIIEADADKLANLAAELIYRTSVKAHNEQRTVYIALSGGSTPKAMGQRLAQEPFLSKVHWDRVVFFWGDERWVPLESSESNAGEAKRTFLDNVGIDPSQVHPFQTTDVTPEASAEAMESLIRELVPGTPVPRFDLILLGMGDDGHTASLFPGTEAIQEQEKLVVAHEVEKLGATRLTFTPALINAAKHVAFLVGGANKANVLSEVLDGGIDVDRLPSQVIRPIDGTLTWIVDHAAAAELERYNQHG